MRFRPPYLAAAAVASVAAPAFAQTHAITWFSITPGNTIPASGATYGVAASIGQSIASAPLSGPTYSVTGGFSAGIGSGGGGPAPCYANCDGSTFAPVLNVNDFTCFLNAFAAQQPYANCDGSTSPPTLNVNDFFCFLNRYAIGCP